MLPDHDEHVPAKPVRRPGHERDDSRREREKDYVKEVRHPPSLPHHSADSPGRQQH